MSKERKLGKITRALLVGSLAVSCRKPVTTLHPSESIPPLPSETPQTEFPELSYTLPEIEFIKDYESQRAGEFVDPEEERDELFVYNENLISGFCQMMDCGGFNQKIDFYWDYDEVKRIWREEGIEPIVYYRMLVIRELARQVPSKSISSDEPVTLIFPDNSQFLVSRIKGFVFYGVFDGKKEAILSGFNNTVVLWVSNEFAWRSGLSPIVMNEDREKLELVEKTFSQLEISFDTVWSHYRESKAVEFALFLGGQLGGGDEEERISNGFSLLYALDRGDTETIEHFLHPLQEA